MKLAFSHQVMRSLSDAVKGSKVANSMLKLAYDKIGRKEYNVAILEIHS
jgi:hypothetical protein